MLIYGRVLGMFDRESSTSLDLYAHAFSSSYAFSMGSDMGRALVLMSAASGRQMFLLNETTGLRHRFGSMDKFESLGFHMEEVHRNTPIEVLNMFDIGSTLLLPGEKMRRKRHR